MIEIKPEEAPVRGWTWWRVYVDGVRLLGHWDSEEKAQQYVTEVYEKLEIAV